MVFFAGLPATGKSLLVHQLAHLAHARRRPVSLLQYDVARPVIEQSPAGRRYPQTNGETHPVVRRATGLWARQRVIAWAGEHGEDGALLLGETPLVGGRLIELTTPEDDAAEPLLTGPMCRFVLAVPSNNLRRHIETVRAQRFQEPQHQQELEDAPPEVLRSTWEQILALAAEMEIDTASSDGTDSYDSRIYTEVYREWLRHRPVLVLPLAAVLPTQGMSVYTYQALVTHLTPTAEEAERYLVAAAQG